MVLCGSIAAGQFFVAPSPEGTLSVTATGSAESPADWAEVRLTVEGKGATAQEALSVCDESWRKVLDELATLQIPEKDIHSTPPDIGLDATAQMVAAMGREEGDEGAKQTVRRGVTVRLAQADEQTLYEGICRIIDVTGDAGAAIKAPGPLEQVWSQQGALVFGVNDPKPLRAQAIRNGLAAAKEVADVVAASMERKLGALAGVQVQEVGTEGYLGMLGAIGFPPKPGQGVYRVSLTVTYHLE